MRHRLAVAASLLAVLFLASSLTAAEPGYRLSVANEPTEAIYTVGSQAKFVITLRKGDQPVGDAEVGCTLDVDGMPPVIRKQVKVKSGTAVVEGTLASPGFLRCTVSYAPKGGKAAATAVGGAAFDPLKIPGGLPMPKDFEAFWNEQKTRLAAVPMNPQRTPVKSGIASVEAVDVQIACLGPRPVTGYFAKPIGAAPKSLPAILTVHGAGVRGSSLGGPVALAKRYNALAMDINAHGIPNGKPESYYKDLADGELKGYQLSGRNDRGQCYFLGMFQRLMRAMDFLTSQPEWDGKILIVKGSSQGGGQAIAAAGLDPRVTFIAAGVPAICDHSGKAVGRINGWPKLVPDVNGAPDPQILETARYFDCVNFAALSKAEAVVSVGFIDAVCPPTSVYAAYNRLSGKKQMVNEPWMGHAVSPKFEKIVGEAIDEHIAQKQGGAKKSGQ